MVFLHQPRALYHLVLRGSPGTLGSAGLESVVESAVDLADVLHAAGTGGSASESLLAPVDCSRKQS